MIGLRSFFFVASAQNGVLHRPLSKQLATLMESGDEVLVCKQQGEPAAMHDAKNAATTLLKIRKLSEWMRYDAGVN